MGSTIPHRAGPVTFALDLAGGPEWTGRSLDDIVERFRALPILDDRSAEEILGHGDDGLPG